MKKILTLGLFIMFVSCKSQIYSLRPSSIDIPEGSYEKDTNNELSSYEGIWKANWNNKTIFIAFKKITNKYDDVLKYYKDCLIAKFKVVDNNGNVLFDNTNIPDNKAKIEGVNFRRYNNKYSLIYIDNDLCGITGDIAINFTDSSRTKLEWKYSKDNDWLDSDCFYWNLAASQRPEPLPYNIILTRQ